MSETGNPNDSDARPPVWDTLLVDVCIATMEGGYGIIEPGAIALHKGLIAWVGRMDALPGKPENLAGDIIACGRIWATPGLIDSHTHLIHGGTYPQSAAEVSKATHEATDEHLLEVSARRLVALLEEGVTSVGIHAGYGLQPGDDERIMDVARTLPEVLPMHLLAKLDGAIKLPEPFPGTPQAFSEEGVRALAAENRWAVLLPGIFYNRDISQKPLLSLLREHKVPLVVSTDCNPVTSPCDSPLLALNMAHQLFGLTPEEALLGMTAHAARALGFEPMAGTIAVGKMADLALWDIAHPDELSYQQGYNPCLGIYKSGMLRRTRE